MANVFTTGVTGLSVAQAALNTIAQNVANANTPGYARQQVIVTSQTPSKSGVGYIGNGAAIAGIAALVDPYLEAQLTQATGVAAGSSQSSAYYNQLQLAVGDSASGISANQAAFQTAVGQAATNPSSIPARQLVLSTAKALSDSINAVAGQLQTQKQGATQTLGADVAAANSILQQIAKLNDSITKAEPRDANGAVLSGQEANDLRAQRQTLVNQLSTYANVTTVDQTEGLTVSIGGAAVVISNKASTLATQQDPIDPTLLAVGIKTPTGQVNLDAGTLGGKIGATLDYVTHGVEPALAQINQLSGVLAQAVNDQSAKGVDLNGNPGSAVLSLDPPSVAASSKNTGTLTVGASVNAYATQPSDYRLAYSTANGYVLTRLSDNTTVASGASLPLTADGLTLSASAGAPVNGDSYLIKPFGNQAADLTVLATDPRQLALADPVASAANASNTSSASISAPTVVSGLPLNANLTSAVSIAFTSPTAYTISGPGIGTLTNQPYVSGAPISYNGWSVSITGAPHAGDTFGVSKSNGAVGDGSNANALSALLQGKNFGGGTESLADLYANIQSDAGNKASLAQTNATSDASVLGIAQSQRESFSGVNLDQEAADLARWQQIYSANAQVMSVAQKLFEGLITQFG